MTRKEFSLILLYSLISNRVNFVVLRGKESIYGEMPINDLDIYIPTSELDNFTTVLRGLEAKYEFVDNLYDYQKKCHICLGEDTLEIDLFHNFAWRNIEFFSFGLESVSSYNGVPFLNDVQADVLILLKELLHNKRFKHWGGFIEHCKRSVNNNYKAYFDELNKHMKLTETIEVLELINSDIDSNKSKLITLANNLRRQLFLTSLIKLKFYKWLFRFLINKVSK